MVNAYQPISKNENDINNFISQQLNLMTDKELFLSLQGKLDHIGMMGQWYQRYDISKSAEEAKKLISELKNRWDVVLFDLPPLMAVTDAYVILREMDQFLLVLRAGITQKGALKRSKSYLELAGIDTTGVVINQIDKSKTSKDEHFDYYEDYYGIEEE